MVDAPLKKYICKTAIYAPLGQILDIVKGTMYIIKIAFIVNWTAS